MRYWDIMVCGDVKNEIDEIKSMNFFSNNNSAGATVSIKDAENVIKKIQKFIDKNKEEVDWSKYPPYNNNIKVSKK